MKNEQNNKHSSEELAEWQAYSLSMKKSMTASRIRELAKEYEFYVSFSGGKDSEVAVDFTAKVLSQLGYNKMYVLNIRTGLEYFSVMQFCEPFCKTVAEKYGIEVILDYVTPTYTFSEVLVNDGYPVISKEVSQCIKEARRGLKNNDGTYSYRLKKLEGTYKNKDGTLSQYNMPKYKFLLNAPFRISDECCPKTKKDPAIEYEEQTGRIPLIATTAQESRLRRSNWLKYGCNAFKLDRPKSAPFSFWTNNDMLEYIYTEKLDIAAAYGEVIHDEEDGVEGQFDFFDDIGVTSGCKYRTTGCPRTGCIYCLFGICEDLDRIIRLQEMEPKRADYVLRGGTFDDEGYWIPTKEGLGYWFVLDWFAENGIEIPYKNKEKYRRKIK